MDKFKTTNLRAEEQWYNSSKKVMKRNIQLYLFIVVCAMCITSCSNSSELKFLGKNLNSPCKDFENHLEKNGFKHTTGHTYDGKYLGKDIGIVLEKERNGHYAQMEIMLVSDVNTCKEFYEDLCKEIKKEHSGFKEEDKEKDDVISYTQPSSGKKMNIPLIDKEKIFNNEKGKKISIKFNDASIFAMVMAVYEED